MDLDIGEVKTAETNECYRAGASSVYLCLLEIIFVYVLADFASAQTGDTHPKSASGQSSGCPRLAADHITHHLTAKTVCGA